MRTDIQLKAYLFDHPDMTYCPACGGCGEFPLPVGGRSCECQVCHGAQVVTKEFAEAYRLKV